MAIYRKNVYCELEFLEKFKDSKLHIAAFGDDEVRKLLDNLWDFLRKSHLMLNIDNSKLLELVQKEDKSSCLSYLYKGATMCVGGCKITCTNDHKYEYAENIHKNPADRMRIDYLINRPSGVCRNWAQKYGVVIFSPTCWSSNEEAAKHKYLFIDCGAPIEKGRNIKYEWSNLLKDDYNLTNCNSMIIIDNYLKISDVECILNCLLPTYNQREDEFHLTVFIAGKVDTHNFNEEYKQLTKLVKNLRPCLNTRVDLFVSRDTTTFHDRCILTNNAMIKVGAGFDCIKNGSAQRLTNIEILHPYIQNCSNGCDDFYEANIKAAKMVVNSTNRGQWIHYPEGEPCRNRLLVVEK